MKDHVKIITSSSLAETQTFAERLASCLQGGEVITLSGDLGAGKTSFTQGLARGLGVERRVNSPTFTLIKEYQGESLALHHMDMYRVEDEFEELGVDEYFEGNGVSVIEWPQQIQGQLPEKRLDITIKKKSEHARELHIHPQGERYEQLVNEVLA